MRIFLFSKLIIFSNLLCICLLINYSIIEANDYSVANYDTIRNKLIREPDQTKALLLAFELLDEANKINNPLLIARARLEIGFCYLGLGNYATALDFTLQSAVESEDQKNLTELAMAYNSVGAIYQNLNNYNLSIHYLNKAIKIHSAQLNEKLLPDDFLNLGETYRLMNNFDSALYYYYKALNFYVKIDYKVGIAYVKCNIGLSLYQLHADTTGMALINESLVLLESLGEYYPICYLYIEMGKKQMNENNLDQAILFSDKAYKIASTNSFNDLLIESLNLLSDLAQRENDYLNAFKYSKECQYYRDSIYNSKIASQLAEKRTEYEVSRKEIEIDFLKKITQVQRYAAIFLTISIIFLVAFIVFIWRTSKRRKTMNKLLAEQNHELDQKNHIIYLALEEKEVLMREIHHRVKNNLQIISSLINLQSLRIEDPSVKEIFEEMQRRIMAISSIHQKLYQSDSVSFINMKDYIGEIIDSIHVAFSNSQVNVNYEIQIQNISLNIDYAVALGLIVNELATNSYKYAFKPGIENQIVLSLILVEEGSYKLILLDNGPGLPDGLKIEQCQSLGLRMVLLLTRQIKGLFSYRYNSGAEFAISFRSK